MLLWETYFAAGQDKLRGGAYGKAEELLKSALAEAESCPAEDPRLLQTRLALVEVFQKSGQGDGAEPYLAQAEQQIAQAPGLPPELTSRLLQAKIDQVQSGGGETSQQLELGRRLVALWREAGPEHQGQLVESLLRVADYEVAAGEERAARQSLEQALEASLEQHGLSHAAPAEIMSRLARALLEAGDPDAAEKYARRALTTLQGLLSEGDPTLAAPLAFLAGVLERQKRSDEALPLARQAAELEGEQRTHYQLQYVAALLRAGKAEAAGEVLGRLDRARLPEERRSHFDLYRLRAFKGVGELDAVKEQAELLAFSEQAAPVARIEALVELAEQNPGEENLSGYLSSISELADPAASSDEGEASEPGAGDESLTSAAGALAGTAGGGSNPGGSSAAGGAEAEAESGLEIDGDLLTRVADLAGRLGNREMAEAFYDRAISARSQKLDANDPASVSVLFELGTIQERRRLLLDAATSWERALESLRRHSGKIGSQLEERRLRLRLVWKLAEIYVRQRRWERAEQAWRSLVRSSAPGSAEQIRGRLGLVQVLTEQDMFRKALETMHAEGGLEVPEATYGREMSDAAFLLNLVNLAESRQLEEAREALDRRFELRGAPHLSSIRELAGAVVYAHCANDEELLTGIAEEMSARRPGDVEEQLLLARFYALVARHNSKLYGGKPLLGLGVLEALNKAAAWAVEANGEVDLRVAELLEEKGRAAVLQGAWEEGEEATRRVLELRRMLQGDRSATLLPSLQRLGELQLGRGQLEEAVPSLEQALSLAEAHLPPRDPGLRELLRSLVEAHRRRGEFDQSRTYLLRLLDLYDKYEDLRPEEKLDDLLRGIRLLLGDDRDHRLLLSDYLDEAMELAIARGEIAALSLAFCLGQKARLQLRDQPDQAVGLLRRQGATLEQREEAREFMADQLLLGRLLLYRGQPQSVLGLLRELDAVQPPEELRPELQPTYHLVEAHAYLALGRAGETGRNLDFLEEGLNADRLPNDRFRAEVLALQLFVYAERPDLVGEEAATRAYANLDRLVEEIDWSAEIAAHEQRERWAWELARLRFETSRLSPAGALERLKDHVARVREDAHRSPTAVADALTLLAAHEEGMGLEDAALVHLDQALKLTEEAGDSESLGRARLLQSFARIAERLDRNDLALGAYREAVGDLKTHLGPRHRDLVDLYLGLGRLNQEEGDRLAAESALLQALAIVDEEEGSVPLLLQAQVMVDLAELMRRDGRTTDSLELWKRVESLFLQREELLPTPWLEAFLDIHIASDREAEALAFFLDGLPFRLGQEHDAALIGLYARWLELSLSSPFPKLAAERSAQLLEVRDLVSAVLDPEPDASEGLLWSRALVAFARMHLNGLALDAESARRDLDLALVLREQFEGPESAGAGEVLTLRAGLAREEGDLAAAEIALTRALNISETQVGPDSWEVAEILLHLAQVYFQKHKFSPTEAVLQRTLELCRQLLGDLDRRWIEVYHLQGKLSLELGRPVEAFEALEKALSLSRTHAEPLTRSLLVAAGRASLLTERTDLALELLRKAETKFPEETEAWDVEAEEVVMIVGELCLGQGLFAEAEERLVKVLAVQEQRFGFGDPRLARVYRALALSATGMRDLDLAEERLEIALAFQEEDLFSPLDLFGPYVAAIEAHRSEGREERAAQLLEENLERCREADRPEKVARLGELLARSREGRGDQRGAEEAWKETIDAWEDATARAPKESRETVMAELLGPLQALGRLLSSNRRYTEAEELTKRRLKITELLEADEQEVADVLFDLAELYRLQSLFRESEELHQRVMATKASELGRTHPEVSRSVRALGQLSLGEGKLEQALSYLERALENQTQSLGENHPEVAETMFALGDTALAQEDFRVAEERFRRALEILEEHYGAQDIRTARGWTALAGLYERKQQWSRARPLLGRAVSSVEAVLGPSHLEVADLLVKTAEVYLVSGAWDEVSGPLERALEIRQDKLGEEHPAVARTLKLKGDLAMTMGDVVGARRLYSKADQIITTHHGAESVERLPFRLALAGALRELDEFEQAHSHLTTLLTAAFWAHHRGRELAQSDIHEELAKLELARGALPVAENFAKQTLDVRSRLLGPQSEGVASAMETLARIHRHDGRTITASALAERALDARSGSEAPTEGKAVSVLGRARVLTLLARLELDGQSTAKATELASDALTLRRDLMGDEHPEVAASLHLLGEIAVVEKRLEKAESYFEQALERWEKFFGGAHPAVFQAVTSLAQLFAQQGRLTLAEQYHQRNLVALEGRYGSDHPILADTLLGLGKLCRSQGNAAAAEKYLKRAAELQTAVYGESDPKVASVLHALALVYQDQRNYLAAEALLKKAQQIRETSSSEETAELTESNLALARLYRSSGKVPEAEPLLKRVLDWRTRRYGDNHPEVASILREMAEIFADQKQYLKAQALVRRALDIYGAALGHRNLELVGPLRQLARLLEAAGEIEEAEVQRQLARELMGAG